MAGKEWEIAVLVRVGDDTPDGAAEWLKAELAMKLQPGEEGSPWQQYSKGSPSYVVGAIREVRPSTNAAPGSAE